MAEGRKVTGHVVVWVMVEVGRHQHDTRGTLGRAVVGQPHPSQRPLARRDRVKTDSSRQSIGESQRWCRRVGMGLGLICFGCIKTVWTRSQGGIPCWCCAMLFIFTGACLVVGIGFVATAQRRSALTRRSEKVGGMLIVVGLIGLGIVLANARR